LALTSPTGGGRSVGIVRSRTKATEFSFSLYGCETWSFTLREDRRLRVFENRVLRRIFGPKRDKVTGSGVNYIMRNFMICTAHQIFFG